MTTNLDETVLAATPNTHTNTHTHTHTHTQTHKHTHTLTNTYTHTHTHTHTHICTHTDTHQSIHSLTPFPLLCVCVCVCRVYFWTDESGRKLKCSAPLYTDYALSYIQELLSDEDVFPVRAGKSDAHIRVLLSERIEAVP